MELPVDSEQCKMYIIPSALVHDEHKESLHIGGYNIILAANL